jgi:hypothetical protein
MLKSRVSSASSCCTSSGGNDPKRVCTCSILY